MSSSKGASRHGSQKKVGFFDLATEIRVQIYEIFLLDDQPVDIAPSHWRTGKPSRNDKRCTFDKGRYAVHIFLICKRIYYEASWIFYGRNTFQLTISYNPAPNLAGIYPVTSNGGLRCPFFIQGKVFWPGQFHSSEPRIMDHSWYGTRLLRWEYAMPTDLISRAKVERQAKGGQKPTRIYWPAERYRSFVKSLRIELIFEIDGLTTYPLGDSNIIWAMRAGLRSLFDGILQQSDIELHLKLPPPPRLRRAGQTTTSPSDGNTTLSSLKHLLLPFAPLGSAKTLRVTTKSSDQQFITSKECEKLNASLVKHSKKLGLEYRPPWRP